MGRRRDSSVYFFNWCILKTKRSKLKLVFNTNSRNLSFLTYSSLIPTPEASYHRATSNGFLQQDQNTMPTIPTWRFAQSYAHWEMATSLAFSGGNSSKESCPASAGPSRGSILATLRHNRGCILHFENHPSMCGEKETGRERQRNMCECRQTLKER